MRGLWWGLRTLLRAFKPDVEFLPARESNGELLLTQSQKACLIASMIAYTSKVSASGGDREWRNA